MFSRSLTIALRLSPPRVITQITAKNATSASTEHNTERDPAPYFFSKEIQHILKTITRPDVEKVFRPRLDGRSLKAPEYKFMTNEQLQTALKQADSKMKVLLQMPPVVKIRKEDDRVLSKDPALKGFSESKFVFTDITYGVNNNDRVIVVRELDGTLRNAVHEERDRLNQIYFPIPGREIFMPKMFQQEYLEAVLARGDYEFILDRACVQFDPDNPEYHRVVETTYDYVDEKMHYESLRSTRHYGPMVFYLAWNKKIDNLLFENIAMEKIEDAVLTLKLYYRLYPSEDAIKEDPIQFIEHYIKTDAGNRGKLNQTLKMYLELEKEKKTLKENTDKAHGVTESSNEEIKT